MNFQHKTIFITGGSTGIGLAIANAFVQQGNHIIIFARTVSKLELAIKEMASHKISAEQKISFYNCDTSNYNEVQTIFQKAIEENGSPDILINCVGIAQPGYFEEISFESFDHTIKTNLYSTWNVCSVVAPFMKKNGGHILNTSSIAGFVGVFGYTDYCMAKSGIIGYSEALRSELKPYNIFVSVLCPPDTDTPGLQLENATKPEETKAISGNAKLLKPEFVAQEVLRQLQSKKFMIIPGMDGKFTLLLKRFFPLLLEWFMDRSIQKVQRRK
ncbi:MAG: Short-chain dehydrogenase/reductase [Bacteroidota bacterium]|nr:Short-chain dehydrogenase/reductase [Bacteroidota bacterium]